MFFVGQTSVLLRAATTKIRKICLLWLFTKYFCSGPHIFMRQKRSRVGHFLFYLRRFCFNSRELTKYLHRVKTTLRQKKTRKAVIIIGFSKIKKESLVAALKISQNLITKSIKKFYTKRILKNFRNNFFIILRTERTTTIKKRKKLVAALKISQNLFFCKKRF